MRNRASVALFFIILLILLSAPLHAYQSDRIKKTVISSNIEERDDETTVSQAQTPKQPSTGKVTSPSRPTLTQAQPSTKRFGVSFAYHDQQNPKPSIPYLRIYLDNDTSIDMSAVFRNINQHSNYSLLDFSFLRTIHTSAGLLVRNGAGIAVYSDPSTTLLLSYILGLEKELVPGVSLGIVYEPCVFSSNSDTGTSLILINGMFSTRLTWQL